MKKRISSLVVGPGCGEEAAGAWGSLVTSVVTAARSGRPLAALDVAAAPGWRRRTCSSPQEDEFLYVAEGRFEAVLGDRVGAIRLDAGCLIFVPAGLPRSVRNNADDAGRLLILRIPPGAGRPR